MARSFVPPDPQRSWAGPGETLAKVAEWMRLCECGHPQVEHDIVDVGKKKGQRSGCLTTEGKTKCPCTLYAAASGEDRAQDRPARG